ncbi:MAG: PDZ domain-containing protein [Bacteroidetes bacterium]|nr:PDZ domain-containing protein [Bacteroidota bacterium]
MTRKSKLRLSKRVLWVLIPVIGLSAMAFRQVEDYFEVSKNLDIFSTVYREVNLSYVDEVKPGNLIREAIDAMLLSLDPYTNFYSEAQAEDYRFQFTGSYGGIGATVRNKGKQLVIDKPYEGYPAQKAGLRAGDILLTIDGKTVEGKKSTDLNELLKGTAGTAVVISVERPGIGKMDFTLERAQIHVKNVPYFGMVNNQTGYIKLTGFTADAGKEVRDAAASLIAGGAKNLILDLRGNGGGLLHEAVNIVNVFVKKNQLVVTTKGRDKENDREYKTLNTPVNLEIPLVVLIDEGSASASEIVSGTIQDLDRGVLIGVRSFGKGLVQTSRGLSYNTQMKITTAKYYIPSGRCIQKLDYAHKSNGKAITVADSLKQVFYTVNKRKVMDGEGVTPDIIMGVTPLSKIAESLQKKDILFDFATLYRNRIDSIQPAKEFRVSHKDFSDFKSYLKDKDYGYTTDTERALDDLEQKAKDEEYLASLQDDINKLRSSFTSNKEADIDRHESEISNLLATEIASRYYFDRAVVESTFDFDRDIQEALRLFSDINRYNNILKGKN